MPTLAINVLRSVVGVNAATIRNLGKAGYSSLDDLMGVPPETLMQVKGVGEDIARAIAGYLEQQEGTRDSVRVYRYDETRKNIPPAGLAAQGKVAEQPPTRYTYDPHLSPVLQFDESGQSDGMSEPIQKILQKAKDEKLTPEDVQILAAALHHRPWLEWTGKRERNWFEVDPVALHIHERVSAEAIIGVARRQDIQRNLFADPEMEYRESVKFYQYDIDWANRLILGDSLMVMNSLAKREDLAGKVQMIYIDPPYGIKFGSNFQPFVSQRTVKDSDSDLTREPEQVKAYRDTWTLGVHSYLTYLRQRIIAAKELLNNSGSVFVQIGEQNAHLVRTILEEIFGSQNFVAQIAFAKTSTTGEAILSGVCDYLLWFAKDVTNIKARRLYMEKRPGGRGGTGYTRLQLDNGEERPLLPEEVDDLALMPKGARAFAADNITSQRPAQGADLRSYSYNGREVTPGKGTFKTDKSGLDRLANSGRLIVTGGEKLAYRRYLDDFPVFELNNLWIDTVGQNQFGGEKAYIVQTGNKVIERCLLMTTDPGDLVLDPTCGSGTTAYVAEQWGRRWITIDTSRVAIALARQRLLTAQFDYYEKEHPDKPLDSERNNFKYETIPHIMLSTIAQCHALDSIFDKWRAELQSSLDNLNARLLNVTLELRTGLRHKLVQKEKMEGKRTVTEVDRRRLLLPAEKWEEWEVPYDSDPDWPEELQSALKTYRQVWRQKMDEVDETIRSSATEAVLVDKPLKVTNIVRVTGPFTVEGVQPLEESDTDIASVGDVLDELEIFAPTVNAILQEPRNAEAHIESMVRLLRNDGMRFPDNRQATFSRLELLNNSILHGDGEWEVGNEMRRVAVALGPQYGPITALQVEESLRAAYRHGYDDVIFAGFTVDGAAQAAIQDDPNPRVRCHLAFISPDVHMGDLLKETTKSQLFSVFGLPRAKLEQNVEGQWIVEMEGVDIYDPATNTVTETRADKIAAWFLDGDYDGGTFCITQAFFPDPSAWDKLARALKTLVDAERFAALSGKRSLPFTAGKHKRAAIKIIDPRGNEVMRILRLSTGASYV